VPAPKIAYFTDIEGQWSKLEDFIAGNPWVSLSSTDQLHVKDGGRLVFGGDAIDRGPAGRRIVRALLEVKRRQPSQVVLLAGNRDINKMRLATELTGSPPAIVPPDLRHGARPALLRWIFDHTMGARQAFRFRAEELAGDRQPHDDEAVVDSFLADVAPGGDLAAYLAACQLAHREGATLFVHGGISPESLGFVPGEQKALTDVDVDAWCERLNRFYAEQCAAFLAGEPEGYAELVAYQAPVPGTRENNASVVYGRNTDQHGTPVLPDSASILLLRRNGIDQLVVGHTPTGDCPALLRDGAGFQVLYADNSYGRIEPGSQVFLDDEPRFAGATVLDDGERAPVLTLLNEASSSPLGLRDAQGRLVKARLARGDYLLFRGLPHHQVEQTACSAEALAQPLGPATASRQNETS